MAKKDQKKAVSVSLSGAHFPVSLWFNQFKVENIEGGKLVHFGLYTDQGLISSASVFLQNEAVELGRESTLAFAEKIGALGSIEAPTWRGQLDLKNVPVANLIMMSSTGVVAEVRLGVFSHGEALEIVRRKEEETLIKGSGVALLQCNKPLIGPLVEALYT